MYRIYHVIAPIYIYMLQMFHSVNTDTSCLFHYLYLPASTFCNVLGSSSAFANLNFPPQQPIGYLP